MPLRRLYLPLFNKIVSIAKIYKSMEKFVKIPHFCDSLKHVNKEIINWKERLKSQLIFTKLQASGINKYISDKSKNSHLCLNLPHFSLRGVFICAVQLLRAYKWWYDMHEHVIYWEFKSLTLRIKQRKKRAKRTKNKNTNSYTDETTKKTKETAHRTKWNVSAAAVAECRVYPYFFHLNLIIIDSSLVSYTHLTLFCIAMTRAKNKRNFNKR